MSKGAGPAVQRTVVDSPFAAGQKNIWTDIIDKNKVEAKAEAKEKGDQGRPDAVLFVVGAKGAGKTTLVSRFLYPDKTEVPKPTEGMDYNYARKAHPTNIERKDVAHIWEIAGTRQFADEATEQENVFMGMRQVTTAVVLIVLDLSKPHEVLPTLEYWLSRVKSRAEATFGKLEKRSSRLPEQLRARSKKVFGANHDDAKEVGVISHSGVTVVIAATKYDAFKNADAELKKVMSRTLRFLAHTNAAALFYLGGLRGGPKSTSLDTGADDDPAAERDRQLNPFRAYLNHLVFTGADKPLRAKLTPETDHLKPALLPIGSDRLSAIGVPRGGGGGGGGEDALQAWRDVFNQMFPKPAGAVTWVGGGFRAPLEGAGGGGSGGGGGAAPERYPEHEVDAVRNQRQAELEQFRKQQAALRSGPVTAGKAKAVAKKAAVA
mmetsp:Transcript_4581/g.11313  ORF Transcript_4581/g.11313 Transcript_4581/m.11313 type:complete len:434 (-) Transcript_4581:147-1448(-)